MIKISVVGHKILAVSYLIGSVLLSIWIFDCVFSYYGMQYQGEIVPKWISLPLFVACIILMGCAGIHFHKIFPKK